MQKPADSTREQTPAEEIANSLTHGVGFLLSVACLVLLVVFSAPGDHWSFARETADGSVDLVTEKKRISELCSNGMYWFRSGSEFLQCAQAHIAASPATGEYYVAPIYNQLIQMGKRVEVERVQRVLSFGTPAEYIASEATLARWLS